MSNKPQNAIAGARRERRTLKISEWPEADRVAWEAACKRSNRLKKGGSASHLKTKSQEEYARRYGLFLGFLKQKGRLDLRAPVAAHVNPENIKLYIDDLTSRVRSVTAWNSISMVHRLARFIAPGQDFSWLREIDNDLAFVMQPKSKLDRFVLAERLVEAGLKMVDEAKQSARAKFKRARAIRNGLMIALWTLCPSRRQNFATLEIRKAFRQLNGKWWITIAANETKTRQRPEERPIADWMNPYIDLYLNEARPVLLIKSKEDTNALWISDKTGSPMTKGYFSSLIPQLTKYAVGVAISPHLFRTAAATTAAVAKGDMPNLGTPLLGHTKRGTTEDYIRPNTLAAGDELAIVLQQYGSKKLSSSSSAA